MCDIMMRLFALFMYLLNAIERAIFFVFSYTIPWKYCAFTNASASAHFYFISSFSIQHFMLFLLFSSEIRSLVDLRVENDVILFSIPCLNHNTNIFCWPFSSLNHQTLHLFYWPFSEIWFLNIVFFFRSEQK